MSSNNNQGTMNITIDRSPEVEKEKAEKEAERKAKEDAQRLKQEAEKKVEDLQKQLDAERKEREAKEQALKEKEEQKKKLAEEKDKLEKEAKDAKSALEAKEKAEKEAKEKADKEEADKKKADFEKSKSEFFEKAKNTISAERIKAMEDSIKTESELASVMLVFNELETNRQAFVKQQEEEKKKKANGSVSLQNTEGGKPLTGENRKGYETYKEMMDDLREREFKGDPEAKQIINAFWLKEIQDVKERHKQLVSEVNTDPEPLADKLNRKARAIAKMERGVA
jgi:hypothetical protein